MGEVRPGSLFVFRAWWGKGNAAIQFGGQLQHFLLAVVGVGF